MTAYRYFAPVFALICALISSPAVPAEKFVTNLLFKHEVQTPAGLLAVVKDSDAEYTFNILLAGKPIGRITDTFATSVDSVYPNLQSARIVVIALETGGTGCPLAYMLVEIKDNGSAVITDGFGNCNAIKDISFKQGAWHFRLPGPGNLPPETWVYRNGKITKLNKPSP